MWEIVAGAVISLAISCVFYWLASRDLARKTQRLEQSERAIVRAVDRLLMGATDDTTRIVFDQETGLPTGALSNKIRGEGRLTSGGTGTLTVLVRPSKRRIKRRLGPRLQRH